ncbi:Kanadaptin [Chytriomyces hyalinus]|nr:Kanadaptin [Chytriomyces hyalinus]
MPFVAPLLPASKLQPSIQSESAVSAESSETAKATKATEATETAESSETTTNLTAKHTGTSNCPPAAPPLNYSAPEWSATCEPPFYIEILKSGVIVETHTLTNPMVTIGRLPTCTISLEHASLSRHHAILQSSTDALFLYDLASTHGTFHNKNPVRPNSWVRVRQGDMLKFGQSTRVFVVNGGPANADSADAQLDDTELESVQNPHTLSRKQRPLKKTAPVPDHSISWGFAEDASNDDHEDQGTGSIDYDDEDLAEFATSAVDEDAYYFKDPKKALRTWVESRGGATGELQFDFDEEGHGFSKIFVATISLDLDGGHVLKGVGRGSRKKEAEKNAALEACIKLDRRKILRSSTGAIKADIKRKTEKYEDDNDSFYDRTERPKKAKKTETVAETYESLTAKLAQSQIDLDHLDAEIEALEKETGEGNQPVEDELDQFVAGLEKSAKLKQKKGLMDRKRALIQEHAKLAKMAAFAKPHDMFAPKSKVPEVLPVESAPTTIPIVNLEQESTESTKHPLASSTASISPNLPAKETATFLENSNTPTDPAANPFEPALDSQVSAKAAIPKLEDLAKDALPNDTPLHEAAPSLTPEATAPAPTTQPRRRAFNVLTKTQVAAHEQVETEEMVDAVGGADPKDQEHLAESKNKYGW